MFTVRLKQNFPNVDSVQLECNHSSTSLVTMYFQNIHLKSTWRAEEVAGRVGRRLTDVTPPTGPGDVTSPCLRDRRRQWLLRRRRQQCRQTDTAGPGRGVGISLPRNSASRFTAHLVKAASLSDTKTLRTRKNHRHSPLGMTRVGKPSPHDAAVPASTEPLKTSEIRNVAALTNTRTYN